MDHERFDDAARAFGGSASRRAAFRLLASGALGGVAGLLGRDGIAAGCKAAGGKCAKDRDCCSRRCAKGKCTCAKNTHCKGGKVCRQGKCVCDTGVACGPACPCPDGQACGQGICGNPCDASKCEVPHYNADFGEWVCADACTGPGNVCVDGVCGCPPEGCPSPCGSDGLTACSPDEQCCPNGDGSSGICCPDGTTCSASPTSGALCCKEPGCRGIGEYTESGGCCCGIYDSTSAGGGQVCCTREIGQSCASTAECCPDWSGDTVCRNGLCIVPPAAGTGAGTNADCPPERPTWCPPALVDGQMRPGYCANLKTSYYNCGACRNQCIVGTHCDSGFCVH